VIPVVDGFHVTLIGVIAALAENAMVSNSAADAAARNLPIRIVNPSFQLIYKIAAGAFKSVRFAARISFQNRSESNVSVTLIIMIN
jgi:hypothetical protein